MNDFKLNSRVYDDATITSGSSISTNAIKLKDLKTVGFLSVQVTSVSVGTAGKVRLELLCSNDGVNFSVPRDKDGTNINDIVVAHDDGVQLYPFPAFPICKEMKVRATASVANITALTAVICVQ